MYARVKQRTDSTEAINLLAEFREANDMASCTYDLGLKDFLPTNWWIRLDTALKEKPDWKNDELKFLLKIRNLEDEAVQLKARISRLQMED